MISSHPVKLQPVVAADHLFFFYGARPVLQDCTFAVEPGTFTVLAGENGTGKSTFIRLLVGEISPTQGSVRLFGTKPSHFHAWQQLGYVPQDGASRLDGFPATVEEVVRSGLYAARGLWRPVGKAGHQAVRSALLAVGLEGFARTKVSELSGGQRQRVLLARALAGKPALLILDEPTANIDDHGAEGFFKLVAGMRVKIDETNNKPAAAAPVHQARRTVLMVTHDLAHARMFADQILILDKGRTHVAGRKDY